MHELAECFADALVAFESAQRLIPQGQEYGEDSDELDKDCRKLHERVANLVAAVAAEQPVIVMTRPKKRRQGRK